MQGFLKISGVLVLAFVMIICIGCEGNNSQDDFVLKFGVLPDVDSLPFLLAEEMGYFYDAGINVEIIQFKSAMDRDAALQSKAIHGCTSDILAAVFLHTGEFDVSITSITNGRYVLLAGPESHIENIKDFANEPIGVSENTVIEYATYEMLAQMGIDDGDMNMVFIPKIPVRLEMLQEGKISGACLPDPLATTAIMRGSREISDSYRQSVPPGIVLFHDDVISEKKNILKSFYNAYNKAADVINTQGDNYREVLIEKADFPREITDIIEFPQYEEARLPKNEDINQVIEWMKTKELLDGIISPEALIRDVLD